MARRKKNALLQRVEYAAYRGVSALVRASSEEAAARWGARLGALAGRVLRKRTKLALRNLEASFPEKSPKERERIIRECWRHFGRELVGYLRIHTMPVDEIARRCLFINEHYLDEAIADGKGLLLMSGHYGGWEIGGLAIMSKLGTVRTVARPLDNELLEADLARFRERTGNEVVHRRGAARALLKTLTTGGAVILLPDQAVQPKEGVLVPFLGRSAWTTPVPAKMALRAGSTIVFAFCIPDGTRHRIELQEPIRVERLPEDERNPVALTKRINEVISARIAARPELWLWMHDRWKGTGEGESVHGE